MHEHQIPFDDGLSLAALYLGPEQPDWLYVLAHGAGAGMTYPPLQRQCELLAEAGVATFRYQFPYMQSGRRRPDRAPTLERAVRAAVQTARELYPEPPLFAGGRSMGGRMTSRAQAAEPLEEVLGLIFLAFPLHPAKKPGIERAEHLDHVHKPMLFMQGTRDALADLELLRPVCERLGESATLHVVDGGDHSFKVLKRSGRTPEEVETEITATVAEWGRRVTDRASC